MRYILYSPTHKKTIPVVRKTNGEVIQSREITVGARALYRLKNLPDRRYRLNYPDQDKSTLLVKCKTIDEAKQEQEALKNYCGEEFEIHEYENGNLGPKVVSETGGD